MRYAIQFKNTGAVVDYCNTPEEAKILLTSGDFELIDTSNTSVIEVTYTELSGPFGYGHNEISFITYGGIRRCICNLINWMNTTARIFGPDARDIKDYFKHCSVMVNHKDRSQWLYNQIEKIDIRNLYL